MENGRGAPATIDASMQIHVCLLVAMQVLAMQAMQSICVYF